MNKMPTAALCAHLHDTFGHVAVSASIDALVSSIYSHPRTIELCKEIAQLCKCALAHVPVPTQAIHHLPLKKSKGQVIVDDMGIPYLSAKSYEPLNQVLHAPQSDIRDKSLILLTKLHCYVLPLQVVEAVGKVSSMIQNIETPFEPDPYVIERFRKHVRSVLDNRLNAHTDALGMPFHRYNRDWFRHLVPLHDLAVKYYTSQKKRPCLVYDLKTKQSQYVSETTMSNYDAYVLPVILTNLYVRELYESGKSDFLTLVTGKPVLSVVDDSNLYDGVTGLYTSIGRMGMRLQEAEKIRLLWMPLVVFESLTQPIVDALEFLVRTSNRQTAYLDDSISSRCIQQEFFKHGEPSRDLIYSIDQSSFTDNFPYKLQRVVLEELLRLGVIPAMSLKAMDLQATGPYRPAEFYQRIRQSDVRFAKGDPMGGYGLWMLSSISHELLLEMIQIDCGESPNGKFQGDDTVFIGDKTYKSYLATMSSIGCSVNEQKTMVSRHAAEYCGWITTPTVTCPMFRPHDRLHCHPHDLASPRAIEAFGTDKITQWILMNRPEVWDQLRIEGFLPIRDDDDDKETIVSARAVYSALQVSNRCLPSETDIARDRLLFEIQEYYPMVIYDDDKIQQLESHHQRSSIEDYQWKVDMIVYLRRDLQFNSLCDLERVSSRIMELCDDLMLNHTDHIAVLRDQSPQSSEASVFYHKKHKAKPNNSKAIRTALDIAERHKKDSPSCAP